MDNVLFPQVIRSCEWNTFTAIILEKGSCLEQFKMERIVLILAHSFSVSSTQTTLGMIQAHLYNAGKMSPQMRSL